jgi:hypothetical protein
VEPNVFGWLFSLAHNPLEEITKTNHGDAVNQRNTTRRKIAGAIVCINRCYIILEFVEFSTPSKGLKTSSWPTPRALSTHGAVRTAMAFSRKTP